jgi:hypothetical protein
MWRHEFTLEEQTALTLNAKEFLAAEISQLLALKDDTSPYPCHLNIGDSAVAEAWLYKSNHDPESLPTQNEIARKMASNLMKNKAISNYSQHLHGIENIVADSLSRDTHLKDGQLLTLLTTTSPSLLPKNAQILPLSNQITSWITSLAQLPHKSRELRWQHTPSTLAAGITGWNYCQKSQQMIPTLTNSHKTNETQSSVSSWIQSVMENSHHTISIPSEAALRDRLQTMWLRRSNQVVGQIPERQ